MIGSVERHGRNILFSHLKATKSYYNKRFAYFFYKKTLFLKLFTLKY